MQKFDIDDLQYYLSEFGNFLRDNFQFVGAPHLVPYNPTKYEKGTIDEILEQWLQDKKLKSIEESEPKVLSEIFLKRLK